MTAIEEAAMLCLYQAMLLFITAFALGALVMLWLVRLGIVR